MTESEVENESVLGHLHAAMLMVARDYHEHESDLKTMNPYAPEYACLQSMLLEPQNPTMWNSMALVYMMTGRYDDAHDAIEKSLDLDTGNAWTWSIWGDIFDHQGNHLESEHAYRMAIELGIKDPHVLRQLFLMYSNRSNFIDALSMLEQLIPLCPGEQHLWDQYTSYLALNRYLIHHNSKAPKNKPESERPNC